MCRMLMCLTQCSPTAPLRYHVTSLRNIVQSERLAGSSRAQGASVGDAPVPGSCHRWEDACKQGYHCPDAGHIQPAAEPEHSAPVTGSHRCVSIHFSTCATGSVCASGTQAPSCVTHSGELWIGAATSFSFIRTHSREPRKPFAATAAPCK
jgi:hypothetical protein